MTATASSSEEGSTRGGRLFVMKHRTRKFKRLPSIRLLKEYLNYNPKTGKVWWIKRMGGGRNYPGRVITCVGNSGYYMIGFGQQVYVLHRIIWKWMTGKDPGKHEVDHRNLNRLDNRWSNLRLASSSQNMHNMKLLKRNKSGFKGVCWSPKDKVWLTYATVKYKQYRAGRWSNPEDAAKAVQRLRIELHEKFTNHG